MKNFYYLDMVCAKDWTTRVVWLVSRNMRRAKRCCPHNSGSCIGIVVAGICMAAAAASRALVALLCSIARDGVTAVVAWYQTYAS